MELLLVQSVWIHPFPEKLGHFPPWQWKLMASSMSHAIHPFIDSLIMVLHPTIWAIYLKKSLPLIKAILVWIALLNYLFWGDLGGLVVINCLEQSWKWKCFWSTFTLSFQLKGFLNLFEKRKKYGSIWWTGIPLLQVTFHPHGVA